MVLPRLISPLLMSNILASFWVYLAAALIIAYGDRI